jgi:hypothetical protein
MRVVSRPLRVAAAGAILAIILLVVARMGAGGKAGLADTALAIPLERLRDVAGLGAGVAVAASVLLLILPRSIATALRGGFWVGALAMIVIQQGFTFLLFRLLAAVPAQGFSLAPLPHWFGAPELMVLALVGALAGAAMALVLALLPLPDLFIGLLAGVFGLSLLAGSLPVPPLVWVSPGWWANLVINGGWGLASALLMRPLVLRGGD